MRLSRERGVGATWRTLKPAGSGSLRSLGTGSCPGGRGGRSRRWRSFEATRLRPRSTGGGRERRTLEARTRRVFPGSLGFRRQRAFAEGRIRQRSGIGEQVGGAGANRESESDPDRDCLPAAFENQERNQGDENPQPAKDVVRADVEDPPQRKKVKADHQANQGPDQIGTVRRPADEGDEYDAQELRGPNGAVEGGYPANWAALWRFSETCP